MSGILLIFLGIFLPLFPLSMVFNTVFDRVREVKLRVGLLMIWPLVGIFITHSSDIDIPGWVIAWALLTSLLYAFRALALREVGLWVSFIATSAWAMLWIAVGNHAELSRLIFFALGFSAPLALLALLCKELENRFGAAYTDLYGGLALTTPRLSGVLVFVILAIVATPLFPGFVSILAAIMGSIANSFASALTLTIIWLIWSWAGARILQGLIVGPAHEEATQDLSLNATWSYAVVLTILVISGIYSIGSLS